MYSPLRCRQWVWKAYFIHVEVKSYVGYCWEWQRWALRQLNEFITRWVNNEWPTNTLWIPSVTRLVPTQSAYHYIWFLDLHFLNNCHFFTFNPMPLKIHIPNKNISLVRVLWYDWLLINSFAVVHNTGMCLLIDKHSPYFTLCCSTNNYRILQLSRTVSLLI